MAFRPRSRYTLLGASAVAVSGGADTNENILATVNIGPGQLGLNGILRITHYWTITNSANNKTLRIRWSGIGGTAIKSLIYTTRASVLAQDWVGNRGAANSQFAPIAASTTYFGDSTSGFATTAIDTSVATTMVFTGQKASAGETLTLESYAVELLIP